MDSMEVNKGIAAVLVAGIIFFLTGLVADNLVSEHELAKSVLDIKGVPAESGRAAADRPAASESRYRDWRQVRAYRLHRLPFVQ